VFAPSIIFHISKSRWHENLDVLIDEFLACVARYGQENFVHVSDLAALVKQGCPVGKRFQQFLP
jgi:hypothetical protein